VSRATSERLWRARRRHDYIDALVERESSAWTLRFVRNDRVLLTWQYPSRDDARAEARRRLRELQRAGWNVHW
jgi:hypothetical protein